MAEFRSRLNKIMERSLDFVKDLKDTPLVYKVSAAFLAFGGVSGLEAFKFYDSGNETAAYLSAAIAFVSMVGGAAIAYSASVDDSNPNKPSW